MKKKTKVIVSSAMTMAVCASLIAGSTLALFTSESNVNIAITSGKVDVEASVTALSTYSNGKDNIVIGEIADWVEASSDSDGTFTGTFENSGTVNYAVDGGVGQLTLNNITPGDAVKFTLSATNSSTISIKYQVRMSVTEDKFVGEGSDPHEDTKLSSALEVKFGDEVKTGLTFAASEWTAVDATTHDISDTEVIIRLPKDAGNEYQERSCTISLSVLAVQGNGSATDLCLKRGSHAFVDDTCVYCGWKIISLHPSTGNDFKDALGTPNADVNITLEENLTLSQYGGGVDVSGHVELNLGDHQLKTNTSAPSITVKDGGSLTINATTPTNNYSGATTGDLTATGEGSKLTVNGGYYDGIVKATEGSAVELSGGRYHNNASGTSIISATKGATITVSGGTFDFGGSGANSKLFYADGGTIVITSLTIEKNGLGSGTVFFDVANGGKIIISKSSGVTSDMINRIGANCQVTEENGNWVIVEKNAG